MGRYRKIACIVLAAGGLLVLLALACHWHSQASSEAASGPHPRSERSATRRPVATTPAEPTATISGRVLGLTGDGQGASVVAIEDPLSSWTDERCDCVPGCTDLLVECGCEGALERLSEELLLHEQEEPRRFETVAHGDGSFELPVPEGRFTLWARQGRGVAGLGNVASGTKDVQLSLQPAVTLRGRVVGPGEKAVAGAQVIAVQGSLVIRAVSGLDGKVVLENVPDGRWEAVAFASGLLGAWTVFGCSWHCEARFELSAPAVLRGTVLREGRPVAGAEVAMRRGHYFRRTTTDSRGGFSFDRLRPEPVRLTASQGGQCAASMATPSAGAEPPEPVALALGACRTISGTVAGVDGERLTGATVSISSDGNEAKESTRTGPDGSFRFLDLPADWHHLVVELEGYEEISERRNIRADAPLSIVLRRAAACGGTVRDAVDSRPVSGADVRLLDPRRDYRWLEATSTAADGTFRFTHVPAGEAVLEVDDNRYLPQKALVTLPNENLQIVVDPGTTIEGTVFDPQGAPCVGASFDIGRGGFHPETGLDGHYRISGLKPGKHQLDVTPPEGMAAPPAETEIEVGGERLVALDIHLEASELLSGVISDEDGRPVADAWVNALAVAKTASEGASSRPNDHTRSGPDGAFTMWRLPAGSYSVEISANEFDDLVIVGRTGEPMALQLTRGRTWALVRGRVVSPEGTPIKAFELYSGTRRTEDGRFEERFWPEYRTTFEVEAEGFAPLSRTVQVKAGETLELGDLVLSRGSTVSGTVVEAGSLRPLQGAGVMLGDVNSLQEVLERIEHPDNEHMSELSDELRASKEGGFRFEHVSEQSTHLLASEPNHRPELLALPADRENVRVALSRGAEIRGTVRDPEPGAFERIVGWVRTATPKMVMHIDYLRREVPRRVRLEAGGTFRVGGLSPGRYVVTAERPGDESAVYTKTEVEVTADGVATAVVSRRQGLDLMIRVVEADGSTAKYPRAQIVPGDIALPSSAAERQQLDAASEWVVGLREGHGFPALAPGRYTLFVATWDGKTDHVLRQVVELAHDRQVVEVRLGAGLPVFVQSPE